jgi:hypothetical protein
MGSLLASCCSSGKTDIMLTNVYAQSETILPEAQGHNKSATLYV